MPLVQIKGISGYLSLSQKQAIISKVTDAVLSVEGEALRPGLLLRMLPQANGVSADNLLPPMTFAT
ncbi:MAG: tautomerase family protein [Methylobacter sp.]|jgi:4-oxalocrotonate tautomerase|nr:tautomerase family protein [Methylobacter sp.]